MMGWPTELDVAKAIEEAFGGVAYPGDDYITYDQSGYHLECMEIAEAFRGKHWRDLTTDFLLPQSQSLYFFTPEAHAFFISGYILCGTRDYDPEGFALLAALVFSLTPRRGAEEPFQALIAPLTSPQRQAIAIFLKYLEASHGGDYPDRAPSVALDLYWGRYLPPKADQKL